MRVEGVPQEDHVGSREARGHNMEQTVRETGGIEDPVCPSIDYNRKDVQMIVEKIAPLDSSKILKSDFTRTTLKRRTCGSAEP